MPLSLSFLIFLSSLFRSSAILSSHRPKHYTTTPTRIRCLVAAVSLFAVDNGLAEHAIREVKAKIRTLKQQVQELHKIDVDHLIFLWFVEFAAKSTTLGRWPDCVGGSPWQTVQA